MTMNSCAIITFLSLSAIANRAFNVESFSISKPHTKTSRVTALGLWVDDHHHGMPASTSNTNSRVKMVQDLESRAETCLSTSSHDVKYMTKLLQELEQVQYDCSEEGNQTNDECDVNLRDEREALIHALEGKIYSEVASTMAVMLMTTTATPATATVTPSSSIEDQAKACLNGNMAFTTTQMKGLVEKLETLNSDCTEDSNQTNEECDITLKAERDYMIKQLEKRINTPDVAQISNTMKNQKCSLGELTRWLKQLEKQENLCTEEGNQTNDECDVVLKEERKTLMEVLAEQITVLQGKTQLCTKYKLCDTSTMQRSLEDLEALNNMCTEDGNQTRSFCDVEVWSEREEIMETLRHELELAENVRRGVVDDYAAARSVFQI